MAPPVAITVVEVDSTPLSTSSPTPITVDLGDKAPVGTDPILLVQSPSLSSISSSLPISTPTNLDTSVDPVTTNTSATVPPVEKGILAPGGSDVTVLQGTVVGGPSISPVTNRQLPVAIDSHSSPPGTSLGMSMKEPPRVGSVLAPSIPGSSAQSVDPPAETGTLTATMVSWLP